MSHDWNCRWPRCEADEAKYEREDDEPQYSDLDPEVLAVARRIGLAPDLPEALRP